MFDSLGHAVVSQDLRGIQVEHDQSIRRNMHRGPNPLKYRRDYAQFIEITENYF